MNHAPTQGAAEERLQPRLIQGLQAEFIPAEWDGTNTSGIRVFGKNLLVRMDACSRTTAGGVMLPEDMIDRMTEASESGCIYAIGAAAFRLFDDGHRWEGDRPKIGERVYVEKYAGVRARGADGALYRIMDERCISGALDGVYVMPIEGKV